MSLTWQLARRFRKSRSKTGFLSFISASSTLGIGLGCAVLIAALSMMNGFQKALEERLLQLVPQVEFSAVEGPLKHAAQLLQVSRQHPQVVAAEPIINTQGMIQRGSEFVGLQLTGIDLQQNQTVTQLHRYTDQASWRRLQETTHGVLLGQGLAERLQVSPGDGVTLLTAAKSSAKGAANNWQAPRRQRLTVVGTFAFGGQLDYQQAYVSLATAQQLTGLGDQVSSVRLLLNDAYQAPKVARELGRHVQDFVYLDDWTRSQGHVYRDIMLVKLVIYIVLVLVMAVACFNIVSTLVMTVQEKQSQIAILRTMGMQRRAVIRVFIWQGLQNGLWGTAGGVLVGVLLAWQLPNVIQVIEQALQVKLLAADIYFIAQIPSQLRWLDVLLVAAVALLMSLLATLYPAWRASQLQPAQALHR
ncbi:lipoprotein-releasing ABC transporter permease subunit [Idiomarina xiamenensis]|uniref:Lipoprotein release ABC transporter permease n=1 Tax=Idiomarina xiamenensis 10-D-4 TaxID=740709 RepID=K2KZ03_9GAMM|nr:lipoprotein-releasing ABC transporter permease subunit [Idiomarina xiamenensis]EKE82960.1 lipoprotein release ABC transporter permease [Idiomarina xiamenensis 10-D-4]